MPGLSGAGTKVTVTKHARVREVVPSPTAQVFVGRVCVCERECTTSYVAVVYGRAAMLTNITKQGETRPEFARCPLYFVPHERHREMLDLNSLIRV